MIRAWPTPDEVDEGSVAFELYGMMHGKRRSRLVITLVGLIRQVVHLQTLQIV